MEPALRSELMAVPGIAGAEVDDDHGVAGVRVQLADGADAETVGVAVRRILEQHGMRSAPSDDDLGGDGPPPPPGAPGSVVSFPLVGEHAQAATGDNLLESVAVEETPDGVAVLVRGTNGSRALRRLDPAGTGMDEAVTSAVGEINDHRELALVGVSDVVLGGYTVVTVLVSVGERRVSGSSVQRGGRAYGLAQAVWSAVDRL